MRFQGHTHISRRRSRAAGCRRWHTQIAPFRRAAKRGAGRAPRRMVWDGARAGRSRAGHIHDAPDPRSANRHPRKPTLAALLLAPAHPLISRLPAPTPRNGASSDQGHAVPVLAQPQERRQQLPRASPAHRQPSPLRASRARRQRDRRHLRGRGPQGECRPALRSLAPRQRPVAERTAHRCRDSELEGRGRSSTAAHTTRRLTRPCWSTSGPAGAAPASWWRRSWTGRRR